MDPATLTAVSVDTLVGDAGAMLQAWQISTMAGVAAIVHLLTHLLRFKPVKAWVVERRVRWLVPYVAVGLGVVGGTLTGMVQGQALGPAIVTGIMAGLSAIGLNEAGKSFFVTRKK